MSDLFTDAVREQIPLRMALIGANGSGKSIAALRVATAVSPGAVAVCDTERGRAKLYADRFQFKHANATDHSPEGIRDIVRQAAALVGPGGCVVLDSFSHQWLAVLTEADRFGDWKTLTPRYRECLEAMLSIDAHLIVTMRAKVKYDVSEVEEAGRSKPRQVITRLGLGPVQREGVEYEFDILAFLDTDHVATFVNRCDPLVGKSLEINDETIAIISKWLAEGDPPPPPPPFDPETGLLPQAIRGEHAARDILASLTADAPQVDWPRTLFAWATQLGLGDPKNLKGSGRVDWLRRLANAAATLHDYTPGDLPIATDEEIVSSFAFAFSGQTIVLLEPEQSAAEAELEEAAAAAIAADPDHEAALLRDVEEIGFPTAEGPDASAEEDA